MRAADKFDLSVVTVTYNELGNIKLLIRILFDFFKKKRINGEVIIVDDNSPDGTAKEVKRLSKKYKSINLIVRPTKLGIASAYRDGINSAKGRIIVAMDADFSHPPSKIPDLYKAADNNMIAFGSRYIGKKIFETDFAHYIGTTILNKYINYVLKSGIADNTNGFFAIKSKQLRKIRAYTNRFGIDPFANILWGITVGAAAKKLGMTVIEIETPYKQRNYGRSKISPIEGINIVMDNIIFSTRLKKLFK